MTSGLKLDDNSYSVVIDGSTISSLGTYFRKEWSGGDRAPRPKAEKAKKETYLIPYQIPGKPRRIVGTRWVTRRSSTGTYRWRESVWAEATPARTRWRVAYRRMPVVKRPPPAASVQNSYDMSLTSWRSDLSLRTDTYSSPYAPLVTNQPASGWALGLPGFDYGKWEADNRMLKLITKLRSKINGSDFNAGVFLAEAGQSLGMIADSATRLANCITSLKRGNVQRAWRSLKTGSPRPKDATPQKSAADNWIAMSYGWTPLVSDMESGAQFLSRLSSKPDISRVMVRDFMSLPLLSDAVKWQEASLLERIQIVAYITKVEEASLSGISDVASVAWERLPWSFVVDWAIPIGSFLTAASLKRSITATYVITKSSILKATGPSYETTYGGQHQITRCGLSYRSVRVVRTVTTDLPIPLPAFRPAENAFSWKRAANAVALLVQRAS